MKKIFALTAAFVVCTAFNASAGTINSNQTASCNDAKSITLEVANIPFENKAPNGFTSNDRGSANVVVWKSSNFTTVPIALGAKGDNNASLHGSIKVTRLMLEVTTMETALAVARLFLLHNQDSAEVTLLVTSAAWLKSLTVVLTQLALPVDSLSL